MSPTQINQTEIAAMPRNVLADLVAAVQEDTASVAISVKASVQRSHEDQNSCMMGGWTS